MVGVRVLHEGVGDSSGPGVGAGLDDGVTGTHAGAEGTQFGVFVLHEEGVVGCTGDAGAVVLQDGYFVVHIVGVVGSPGVEGAQFGCFVLHEEGVVGSPGVEGTQFGCFVLHDGVGGCSGDAGAEGTQFGCGDAEQWGLLFDGLHLEGLRVGFALEGFLVGFKMGALEHKFEGHFVGLRVGFPSGVVGTAGGGVGHL